LGCDDTDRKETYCCADKNAHFIPRLLGLDR